MNVPRIPGLDRNDFWSVFQKTPGTLIVSEKQVKQDRLSPMDAVMRSAQYAINAMDAAHKQKKREPLEVWRVNRADGGSHFALRDGNTTYQMLQSQGWDKFPVIVTKELDEADYTPVGPHEQKPVKGSAMKKTKAVATPTSYLDDVKDQFEEQDPKDEDKGAAEGWIDDVQDDYDDLASRESKAAIMVARRAIHAAAGLLAFNKPQKLPEDAEFLTTMKDRDVYAFEEWFYFVDTNTNEVVEVTLQKHIPFLQKHLKKGFLAKLGLAANAEGMDDQTRKQVAAQLRAAAAKLTAK